MQTEVDIAPLVRHALELELAKDLDGEGDTEPGQKLQYLDLTLEPLSPLTTPPDSPRVSEISFSQEFLTKDSANPVMSHKRKRKRPSKTKITADCVQQPSALSDSDPVAHKTHAQLGKKKRRRLQRQREAAITTADPLPLYTTRPSLSLKHQDETRLKIDFQVEDLAPARGAYIGLRQPTSRRHRTVAELTEEGYKYVPWDGK